VSHEYGVCPYIGQGGAAGGVSDQGLGRGSANLDGREDYSLIITNKQWAHMCGSSVSLFNLISGVCLVLYH
jgi:hypothetical protein